MASSNPFLDKTTIIFDLDGTLIDSAPDLAHAVNHALVSLGLATFERNEISDWVGNGARTLVDRALSAAIKRGAEIDKQSVIEVALEHYHGYYQTHICVDTVMYAGVAETLQALHQQGYQLTIATNKAERYVRPILKGLGIEYFFTVIVGGDTLAKQKPDPEPLLFVTRELSVSPEQCIMVGDSKNDILGAKAASIESVAVTYGYNYGEDIAVYGPNKIIDEFPQLLSLVGPNS